MNKEKDQLFSPWMLILCLSGLLMNIVLAKTALYFQWPLFLDNVGSVLVAALGGPLAGITIGFASNAINAMTDSISMYYGILSVCIALVAASFSRRGWLRSIRGCVAAAFCFMLIGGAVGSVMTWMLYGGGIGEGISAPYANALLAAGWPVFWAQFTADVVIDAADKLVTMIPVYLLLHFYPKALYDKFPLSYLYDRSEDERRALTREAKLHFRRTSVNTRVVSLTVCCLALISVISTIVGVEFNRQDQLQQYIVSAQNTAEVASHAIDGDRVDEYLARGEAVEGYAETKERLAGILRDVEGLEYLYVYQIREDGCHVVLDIDTPATPASAIGSVLPFEEAFLPYREQLLAGEAVEPIISNDSFGHLITVYCPLLRTDGSTAAYVGADVNVAQLTSSTLTYIIKMIAVQFALSILVLLYATWYAQNRIAQPIVDIVELSRTFDHADPELWLDSDEWKRRQTVDTGDEIEELYHTVCTVEENISHNVSQMRETERQLRRSEEIEQKNRELAAAIRCADEASAAKTEFYSRMSHDMRTPMNGILGLVQLSEDEQDSQVLRRNIEKIGDASRYLLGLINDTLDMSKIESKKMELQPEPVLASRLIESLTDMVTPSIRLKRIDFRIIKHTLDDSVWLMADALRVKQIFMNLISNAVKFTPEGGRVTLELIGLGVADRRARVRMVLRDSGVGMSESFLQNHIFQPFSQEHNELTSQYAGTGLGLAIVKRLVELMDGTIAVKSKLGEGTTFTIELCFTLSETAGETAQVKHEDSYERLRGKRVLLCEDQPLNAEIAIRLLQHAGLKTEHAENGRQGVERFAASPVGTFDAVLMDVRMPIMDGMEAARRIRAMERADAKTTPIIAMTANAYAEDREATKAAGMNAHLAKPIDAKVMLDTLLDWIKA